ncbi:hypothetical protein TNCV_2779071 [Trichonephila clavipes]|nr:hypothetical protein TNCV_2779071 [Trichonephila clavipes]
MGLMAPHEFRPLIRPSENVKDLFKKGLQDSDNQILRESELRSQVVIYSCVWPIVFLSSHSPELNDFVIKAQDGHFRYLALVSAHVVFFKGFLATTLCLDLETILLERRQSESVGRRNSRTTFLRSDWPRPFARREVGVEMELGRSENKRPEQRRS